MEYFEHVIALREVIQKRKSGLLRQLCFLAATVMLCSILTAPARADNCGAPTANGLIQYYKMDETTGTIMTDSSGGGNDGTYSADIATAGASKPGLVASSIQFNLTNLQQANAPLPGGYATSKQITVSFWLYLNSYDSVIQGIYEISDYLRIRKSLNGNQLLINTGAWTSNGDFFSEKIPLQRWTHYTIVYDMTGAANTKPVVYQNGEQTSVSGAPFPSGTYSAPSATSVKIGKRVDSSGSTINGKIDDLRVYDRALSAEEAAQLYQYGLGHPGAVIYNKDNAALEYCNGTDWVHAGLGGYNPNAVLFDGSTDLTLGGGLNGVTDGYKFTLNTWFKFNSTADWQRIFDVQPTEAFRLLKRDTGTAWFRASRASDGLPAVDGDFGVGVADGAWHHLMLSVDNMTGQKSAYFDGSDASADVALNYVGDILDFTFTDFGIGVVPSLGWNILDNGEMADLWIDFGTYIDFSKEENRLRFRTADGLPKYLGPDGSLATGKAPDIFLSGDTANWHTNKGTGGGFTENGALKYSSASQPGDSVLVPASTDITSGLKGFWMLNETSGTSFKNSARYGGDATGAGVLDASTAHVAGYDGSAISFDGTGAEYMADSDNRFDSMTAMTVCGWTYFIPDSGTSYVTIVGKSSDGYDGWNWYTREDDGRLGFYNDATRTEETTGTTLPANQWAFYCATTNGASSGDAIQTYLNGALIAGIENAGAATQDDSSNDLTIGSFPGASKGYKGYLDDVRIYNRQLTSDEIKLLYRCGAPVGAMKYDKNYHVASYCNGADWVAMGPVGGTPPTDGLVGYWKLDETSGTTFADSSGNGYNLTASYGYKATPRPGLIGTSLEFSGTDSNPPAMTGTATYTLSNHFTYSAWIYDIVSTSRATVLYRQSDAVLWERQSGDPYARMFWTTAGMKTYTYGIPRIAFKNAWHLVTMTYDGANIRLYVDATLEQTYPIVDTVSNGSSLRIGSNGATSGFDGRLDEVRVYNRALSATEINQLYHFGLSHGLGDVTNGCARPGGGTSLEGEMFFNADHNVLQYCNGEKWIGIGQ